jgi:methionyl-tRNA formyltransferase
VKPRVVFFGTPAIAVPTLRALTEVADVVAVVCQPDKPVGRHATLEAPPTKVAATELGIPVHQPTKVKVPEFAAWVREQRADVAVVLAYGRILTKAVLEAPTKGCLNLHASLLPKYRGAAPIAWAIVRGETETGITLMQMDEGVDTGDMLTKRSLAIGADETAGELSVRLGELGAEMIRLDLLPALEGRFPRVAQAHSEATLAPILKKEDGRLDFKEDAKVVHDRARGMEPWPGAFATLKGKGFKVLRTRVSTWDEGAAPGIVVRADKGGLVVACGRGAIEIVRGQVEGKKALDARELIGGRAIGVGDVLG